jgi:hypothetical protein
MNCKWFQDDNLRKAVLEYIENDETKLPTPLNIKDFASETAGNNDILNKEKLLEVVGKKSQRTPERFARDIMEMEERDERDKIVFLCLLFISDRLYSENFETLYNKLLKDFNTKCDYYTFKRAYTYFQDKIESNGSMIFSHPSYSEALPFILLDNYGIPTKINTLRLRCKLRMSLTEDRREKIQALSLAKECYSMKLDLLINATVVDDAIRFVSEKSKDKE